MNITAYCGLECGDCELREACRCGGCTATQGYPFYAENEPCPIAACAIQRGAAFCGECKDFPCELLTSFSNDEEHGDHPKGARIRHCRELLAARAQEKPLPMRYHWMDSYLLGKPGVTKDLQPAWNWIRYHVGGKMFAAVCLDQDGVPYYINLKLEPLEGEFYREQYEDVIPGYYSNKIHWNSIKPNGAVPDEVLRSMLDKSYQLVLGGLSKKKQREILAEGQ